MNTENPISLFTHGSTWVRADFHLHTKADKEFVYPGEDTSFVAEYVSGLKAAGIRLGVISNHNKFDKDEYKAIRKKARKEEIFLMPGVELSVNDGSNGIHTVIVFSDQWIENRNDYISPFITSMFPGKVETEYQHKNGRSDKNILQVVEELEKIGRDYFLIFAHVEQKSGLWHAMDGGKISDFNENRYSMLRRRTLGFQKVVTHDLPPRVCRSKVKSWFGGWYPAEVEGSDCKSIDGIGKGKKGFIKLGAFSFYAVQYALLDKDNRIAQEIRKHKHSHIRKIRFTGGTMEGAELHFSPELNTLIGIRGSGKSSVLEVLRYALEIPFGDKSRDQKYKQDLVGFSLGSGGKVEIDALDRFGQQYTIRRVWKEPYSEVLIEEKLQPGVSLRETVLHKPIYFGQKDLSSTGEGFEKDLVDKLLGAKLEDVRRRIDQQKKEVLAAVARRLKISNVQERIEEQEKSRQDAKHRLKFYQAHGVDKKLQKRLDFDADVRIMAKGIKLARNFVSDLEELLAGHEDDIRNFSGYESKHNAELFEKFDKQYATYISFINQITVWLKTESTAKDSLLEYQQKLAVIRKGMVEEFAAIERRLAKELKDSGSQNVSSEEFLDLKKRLTLAKQIIDELNKQDNQKETLQNALLVELEALNNLWLEEFNHIKNELDKVGTNGSSLAIISEYKNDKQAFLAFMMEMFRGSGIWEKTYQGLVEKYDDFIDIYKDFENAQKLFGSNPQGLRKLFLQKLNSLLTYQTPNKFTIQYRGKVLQHHSLGQRASALILFVLGQKENDVIIIDQPEDDLDNQTIYEDVIELIREMKPTVQFIFATHNPNIPVLGDAELVHACSFVDDKISVETGGVDNSLTQQSIVRVMEGGKAAFNRRKEIYRIWKPWKL